MVTALPATESLTGGPPATPLKVLVVDDDELVREGARRALAAFPSVDVVGLAASAAEIEDRILESSPEVVVLDIRMPPTYRMEGIEAAHRIRAGHPGIGIVILSQHADPEYALELLRDGSAGRAYLLKERLGDPVQLVEAIRQVACGGSVLDPKVVDGLLDVQRGRVNSRLQELSEQEHAVLGLIASGSTNAAIARELVLLEPAVEDDINSIFRKLGLAEHMAVNQRVAAVLFFLARAPD